MSNTSLIIGESGTGKSTSIRNLLPEETFVINILDKPLPFKGFKKNYTRLSSDGTTGNYYPTDDHATILRVIKTVNSKRLEIKNLLIDDFQYTMANEFMRNASVKGYEKFTEIGKHAWEIVNELVKCRPDLNCFVLSHSENDGTGKMKCKTIGKMLDDKITLEGMFTVVLHTIVRDGQYKFLTNADGSHIAKSPMGMFDEREIDNDLAYVNKQMAAYFDEDVPDLLLKEPANTAIPDKQEAA